MFRNLGYKKKLRFLGIGFLLVLIFIYSFSISDTLDLRNECAEKEQKLVLSRSLENKMLLLRAQTTDLDNIIGEMPDTSRKVMDLLLDNVTFFCSESSSILKEIPGNHTAIDANFEIESNFITVQGTFRNLLNLVYLLEQKKKTGGRVSSINFYSKKDNNTKKTALFLTITVQHYKKRNNVKENT
jgi:hypothetical protein